MSKNNNIEVEWRIRKIKNQRGENGDEILGRNNVFCP
jgi:hypothetical protein